MSTKRHDLLVKGGSILLNRRTFVTAGVAMAAAASMVAVGASCAQAQQSERKPAPTAAQQELLTLSKDKWRWMAERKMDALSALFHEEAVFVHMGGSMPRNQELETIRSGAIQYKNAEIQEASVRIIGTTAIVLNRIRLLAVVGGNEVTNPFVVTEVYLQQGGAWKLVQLSFTRTLG
jgi:hypothetical protein